MVRSKSARENILPTELYRLGPVRAGINKSGRTPDGRILTQRVPSTRRLPETPRKIGSSKGERGSRPRSKWDEEDFALRKNKTHSKASTSTSSGWDLPYLRPAWCDRSSASTRLPNTSEGRANGCSKTSFKSQTLKKTGLTSLEIHPETNSPFRSKNSVAGGLSPNKLKMRRIKELKGSNYYTGNKKNEDGFRSKVKECSLHGFNGLRTSQHSKAESDYHYEFPSTSSSILLDVYDDEAEEFSCVYIEGSESCVLDQKDLRRIANKIYIECERGRRMADQVIKRDRHFALEKCSELYKDIPLRERGSSEDISHRKKVVVQPSPGYEVPKSARLTEQEVEEFFACESKPISSRKTVEKYQDLTCRARAKESVKMSSDGPFKNTPKCYSTSERRKDSFENYRKSTGSSQHNHSGASVHRMTHEYSIVGKLKNSSGGKFFYGESKKLDDSRKGDEIHHHKHAGTRKLNDSKKAEESHNKCSPSSAQKKSTNDSSRKGGFGKEKRRKFIEQAEALGRDETSGKIVCSDSSSGRLDNFENLGGVNVAHLLCDDPDFLRLVDLQIAEEDSRVKESNNSSSDLDRTVQESSAKSAAELSNDSLQNVDRPTSIDFEHRTLCETSGSPSRLKNFVEPARQPLRHSDEKHNSEKSSDHAAQPLCELDKIVKNSEKSSDQIPQPPCKLDKIVKNSEKSSDQVPQPPCKLDKIVKNSEKSSDQVPQPPCKLDKIVKNSEKSSDRVPQPPSKLDKIFKNSEKSGDQASQSLVESDEKRKNSEGPVIDAGRPLSHPFCPDACGHLLLFEEMGTPVEGSNVSNTSSTVEEVLPPVHEDSPPNISTSLGSFGGKQECKRDTDLSSLGTGIPLGANDAPTKNRVSLLESLLQVDPPNLVNRLSNICNGASNTIVPSNSCSPYSEVGASISSARISPLHANSGIFLRSNVVNNELTLSPLPSQYNTQNRRADPNFQIHTVSYLPASRTANVFSNSVPAVGSALRSQRRPRQCRRCRIHGLIKEVRGHVCPNKNCDCSKCRSLKQKAACVRRAMPTLVQEVQRAFERPLSEGTNRNRLLPVVEKYFPEGFESLESPLSQEINLDSLSAVSAVKLEQNSTRVNFDEKRTIDRIIEYIDLVSDEEEEAEGSSWNSEKISSFLKRLTSAPLFTDAPVSRADELCTNSDLIAGSHVAAESSQNQQFCYKAQKSATSTVLPHSPSNAYNAVDPLNYQQNMLSSYNCPSNLATMQNFYAPSWLQPSGHYAGNFVAQPTYFPPPFIQRRHVVPEQIHQSAHLQQPYHIPSDGSWSGDLGGYNDSGQVVSRTSFMCPQIYRNDCQFSQLSDIPGTLVTGPPAYPTSETDNIFHI